MQMMSLLLLFTCLICVITLSVPPCASCRSSPSFFLFL